MGLFFTSFETRERVGSSGPLFMNSETRKRIKTLTGLFYEHGNERASWVQVDLFFMSLKIRKRIKILTVNNQKQIFLGLVGFYF